MKETSNGYIFTRFVSPFSALIKWVFAFFVMLPSTFQSLVLWAYFFISSYPKYFIGTALKYVEPNVIERILFLARDEMNRVMDLDVEHVRENKHLLKFYYGTTDGWVPVKYYEEMKARIPGIDAELDRKKTAHAFVLHQAVDMGKMVADWIRE